MKNPFEYEAANNLTVHEILDYYIEDYNYTRFLESKRNIFLLGERGSGKTMTLLYNSFKIKYQDPKRNKASDLFEKIGIHIPCNTPLFHKKEYLLLDDEYKAQVIAEHYFVLSISNAIVSSLKDIKEVIKGFEDFNNTFKEDFNYIFNIQSNAKHTFLESISRWIDRETFETQKHINDPKNNEFYQNALSLSTFVQPLIRLIKKVPLLKESHFIFLIDDAHDLNIHQVKVLNSWIAFRDHSDFSIKVATAKVNSPIKITSTGGSILEGHDYTSIDLEKPFYSKDSEFGKLARSIIKKRLEKISGIDTDPFDFFPANEELAKSLAKYKEEARQEAIGRYGETEKKKISDHVYKYARAYYFRDRAKSKGNLIPYSGFEIITDLSTGIIRNLLDPCYYMFDAVLSQTGQAGKIEAISPKIQREIIIARSNAMWKRLEDGLDKEVEMCTSIQGKWIFNLFDNLIAHFRERLLKHKSEPRAIMFTISESEYEAYDQLIKLLRIAQMSQILYTRIGVAKDDGKKETYFVPNRILLPTRGLDPNGQHARVSLKSSDLWLAASENKPIPYEDEGTGSNTQTELFKNL
jgi:hypothetical protein